QLELAGRRAPVQLFDVVEHGLDLERRIDKPVRERVERERVVGARRVSEAERHCASSFATTAAAAAMSHAARPFDLKTTMSSSDCRPGSFPATTSCSSCTS